MHADSSEPIEGGAAGSNATEQPGKPGVEEILAAFEAEKMEPAKVSAFYKLGLLLVALMMAILPLVYLALIGGVGYWVYLAFTLDSAELQRRFGADNEVFVFLSGILGIIGIFFLVKPIFARRAKPPAPLLIEPGDEPAVEAFVNRIADAVGASRPREIEVDCNVNAAAGFRRGFWSLLTNDLKLVIGLPLVAGMELRSFGGVVAHEFGHFAQGTGMRLTYLIRSINAWFARVVYERDAWDERLERWSRGGDVRLMVFLLATRLFIWASRRVLWVLMHIGHAISCFAMRQMEYDADSYEVQFAGSAEFPETSRQLQLLGVGSNRAQQLLGESWDHRQLARNLPRLGLVQTRSMPKEVHEAIDLAAAEGKTGIFDTHPSDADRIAAAARLNRPGIFNLTDPATVMFRDFDALAERATRHFYEVTLELPVQDENIVDNALIEGDNSARQEAYDALDDFFFEGISLNCPVFVSSSELQMAPDITENDLHRLRAALKEEAGAQAETFKALSTAVEQLDNLLRARELLMAGFKIKGAEFGLKSGKLPAANAAITAAREGIADLAEKMKAFNNLAKRRLIAGLEARRVSDPADGEAARLVGTLEVIEGVFPGLQELRDLVVGQSILIHNLSAENSEGHVSRMRSISVTMDSQLKKIRTSVSGTSYPFEHPKGRLSLGELIASERDSDADEIFNRFNAAEKCINQIFPLYFRVLGQLALLAAEMTPGTEASNEPEVAAAGDPGAIPGQSD